MEVRTAPATTGDGAAPTPAQPSRRRLPWWLVTGAVALVAALLAALALWPDSEPAPTAEDVNAIVDQKVEDAVTALQSQPPASVTVYEAIRAPLVAIRSEVRAGPGFRPGIGSGVILNDRGDVLTSLHVVDGSPTITVTFSDGTESPATVRSSDPEHDIAVLAPARLPEVVVPAVLGGGAQVGDEAFAVGHPLGLTGSLSTGVISGLDRSFPLANGRTLGGMIQFDAAVNPGNSGGPLLNRNGQVIGIVTGLANPAGDDHFAGIGFAVPIGTAGGAAGAPAR
jgi:S1-C subfamily serine protease